MLRQARTSKRVRLTAGIALAVGVCLSAPPTPAQAAVLVLSSAAPAQDEPSGPDAKGDSDGDPAAPAPPSPRTAIRPPRPKSGAAAKQGSVGSGAFGATATDKLDPYGARPSGVAKLPLADVVRFALENPAVKAAEQEIAAMEAQLQKAKLAWVPMITTSAALSPGVKIKCDDVKLDDGSLEQFDFQYCRTRDDPEFDVNTVRGYFSQLSEAGVRFEFKADMLIPVTTFGKIRNTKRLAKVGVALKGLQKLQVEEETLLRVYQAHTALLLARESITILREANDIIDSALRRVSEDLGGGDDEDWDKEPTAGADDLRDPDDLYKVKLAAIETEQLMRQALKVESLTLSALWALAGAAAPPGFDVAETKLAAYEVSGGLGSAQAYREMAGRNRPEARMAAAAVEARQFQEKLARANFLPDLGVVLSAGVARSTSADAQMSQLYYQDGFNFTRFTAALALRWNWDFHFKVFDLRTAQATTRAAEYREAAARLLLGRDVDTAYGDLVEARYLIDTYGEAVDLSWRLVVSGQQKDSIGGGDAGDLLRALEKWYKNRFEHIRAVQTHNDALARLSRAVGTQLAAPPSPPAADAPSAPPPSN